MPLPTFEEVMSETTLPSFDDVMKDITPKEKPDFAAQRKEARRAGALATAGDIAGEWAGGAINAMNLHRSIPRILQEGLGLIGLPTGPKVNLPTENFADDSPYQVPLVDPEVVKTFLKDPFRSIVSNVGYDTDTQDQLKEKQVAAMLAAQGIYIPSVRGKFSLANNEIVNAIPGAGPLISAAATQGNTVNDLAEGALDETGNVVSSLTTPSNIELAALTGPAMGLKNIIGEVVRKTAATIFSGLGAELGTEGIKEIVEGVKEKDTKRVGSGAVKTGTGGLMIAPGIHGARKSPIPEEIGKFIESTRTPEDMVVEKPAPEIKTPEQPIDYLAPALEENAGAIQSAKFEKSIRDKITHEVNSENSKNLELIGKGLTKEEIASTIEKRTQDKLNEELSGKAEEPAVKYPEAASLAEASRQRLQPKIDAEVAEQLEYEKSKGPARTKTYQPPVEFEGAPQPTEVFRQPIARSAPAAVEGLESQGPPAPPRTPLKTPEELAEIKTGVSFPKELQPTITQKRNLGIVPFTEKRKSGAMDIPIIGEQPKKVDIISPNPPVVSPEIIRPAIGSSISQRTDVSTKAPTKIAEQFPEQTKARTVSDQFNEMRDRGWTQEEIERMTDDVREGMYNSGLHKKDIRAHETKKELKTAKDKTDTGKTSLYSDITGGLLTAGKETVEKFLVGEANPFGLKAVAMLNQPKETLKITPDSKGMSLTGKNIYSDPFLIGLMGEAFKHSSKLAGRPVGSIVAPNGKEIAVSYEGKEGSVHKYKFIGDPRDTGLKKGETYSHYVLQEKGFKENPRFVEKNKEAEPVHSANEGSPISVKTTQENLPGLEFSANPIPQLIGRPLKRLVEKLAGTPERIEKRHGAEGKYIAPRFTAAAEERVHLYGDFVNGMITPAENLLKTPTEKFTGHSKALDDAFQYMNDMNDLGKSSIKLTPEQTKFTQAIRDKLIHMHEEQRRDGPLVSGTRSPLDDPNYIFQRMSHAVVKELTQSPTSTKAGKLRLEFIEWRKKEGVSEAEAKAELNAMFPRQIGGEGMLPFFGAVRKAEGKGIPPSWRDTDFISAASGYGQRFATDLAFYRNLQKDPISRGILNITDDGRGGSEVATELDGKTITRLDQTDDVGSIMRELTGQFTRDDATIQAMNRAVKASWLQTPTGLRDLVLAPFISMESMKPSELHLIAKALTELRGGFTSAVKEGVIRKRKVAIQEIFRDANTLSDTIDSVWTTPVNKLSGREILESVSRANTMALGKLIATSRLLKDDMSFFKEFGPENYTEKLKTFEGTAEAIDWAAARFLESKQGTYDYRGTGQIVREGALSPLLSLSKWNIERFNNFRKHVIEPLKEGNPQPFLMSMFGAVIGGTVVESLNKMLSKNKPNHLTWPEWFGLDDIDSDETLYRIAATIDYSAFAGIAGGIFRDIMATKQGGMAHGFSFPLAEFIKSITDNIGDWVKARSEGSDTHIGDLAVGIAKDQIQDARAIDVFFRDDEQVRERNARRDLNVFERVRHNETSDIIEPNEYLNADIKEFKSSYNIYDIERLATEIVRRYKELYKDPQVLEGKIKGLKTNPQHILPPETLSLRRMEYERFVKDTGGNYKKLENSEIVKKMGNILRDAYIDDALRKTSVESQKK